jgi:hypothetical protein
VRVGGNQSTVGVAVPVTAVGVRGMVEAGNDVQEASITHPKRSRQRQERNIPSKIPQNPVPLPDRKDVTLTSNRIVNFIAAFGLYVRQ